LSDAAFEAMDRQVHEEVADAFAFAEQSPDPDPAELFTDVYRE
jgi:TPP-dependent pyruvate/acetoin dehydrogenase alpha subunit